MAEIAGITTQKNLAGKITHVTIDVKQHEDKITPLLYELGVLEKTAFQLECENGITPEELREHLLKTVHGLWKK